MTRIVGGSWGGRRLVTPPGLATRPTAERVRAAVANTLAAAGGLDGARVLDLYAGSGALGLELLSRGARSAVLVDNSRRAQQAIRANLQQLGTDRATVVAGDALGYASSTDESFDVVVADPPYDVPAAVLAAIITVLQQRGRLRPEADVILERSVRDAPFDWPDPLTRIKTKRYGDTLVCYGRGP